MTETQSFFIDIINLVPDNSILFIQAPSIDNSEITKLLAESPFAYYRQILLTSINKIILSKIIAAENVEEYFQSVEIKFDNKLLFEGYDGMEIGLISRDLILTDRFKIDYINKEVCSISQEW